MFAQFGELEDAVVTTDRVSGKSKGYGFVTFRYAASASSAVAEPEKQLDVRKTCAVFVFAPGRTRAAVDKCHGKGQTWHLG